MSKEYYQKTGIATTIEAGGNLGILVKGDTLAQIIEYDPNNVLALSVDDTLCVNGSKSIKAVVTTDHSGNTRICGIWNNIRQPGGAIITLEVVICTLQSGTKEGFSVYLFQNSSAFKIAGVKITESIAGLNFKVYKTTGTTDCDFVIPLLTFQQSAFHTLKIVYNLVAGKYVSVEWDGKEYDLSAGTADLDLSEAGRAAYGFEIDFDSKDTTNSTFNIDQILVTCE